ncbi:FAD-dependent oxidoreductase [Spirulina sp. CS-785/01]|uniref:NAD(P)/FAD-dependent oxidoreductase n=1 Tax=Spirulina sp. CS-785/01 TaxID=3021716 RepID=UPI00232FB887|nr:FAD-dependent oxidoreductase [Spirulina sp. CS-785/01]MDB9314918.1 FAD-dependent oxidoreductase [Spirulina sp. CS-785/01]
MTETHYDVAIVGAGIAGLICATELQATGQSIILLDKSRGIGGRVATRRLQGTCVDHGLPYLEVQGEALHSFIPQCKESLGLSLWTEQPQRYIVPEGMNTMAKQLAQGLNIVRNCRLEQLTLSPSETYWQLTGSNEQTLTCHALILAFPAPQILPLLIPLTSQYSELYALHQQLATVRFNPCITVMAGYPPRLREYIPWPMQTLTQDVHLSQIIHDSQKRPSPHNGVFVFHSTPQFAESYLDTPDLTPVAEALVAHAAKVLGQPEFATPLWSQGHRWRYARTETPLSRPCVSITDPLPLVCCGDWCLGGGIEDAIHSGKAAAHWIVDSW